MTEIHPAMTALETWFEEELSTVPGWHSEFIEHCHRGTKTKPPPAGGGCRARRSRHRHRKQVGSLMKRAFENQDVINLDGFLIRRHTMNVPRDDGNGSRPQKSYVFEFPGGTAG